MNKFSTSLAAAGLALGLVAVTGPAGAETQAASTQAAKGYETVLKARKTKVMVCVAPNAKNPARLDVRVKLNNRHNKGKAKLIVDSLTTRYPMHAKPRKQAKLTVKKQHPEAEVAFTLMSYNKAGKKQKDFAYYMRAPQVLPPC